MSLIYCQPRGHPTAYELSESRYQVYRLRSRESTLFTAFAHCKQT